MRRFLSCPSAMALLAVTWIVVGDNAALAQPALAQVIPAGVTPGKTTTLSFRGSNLAAPLAVWTSFPAQVQQIPSDSMAADGSRLDIKVTLSAGVPVGIGGIVVGNAKGISDVLYVMIDDLPIARDNNNNHSLADAQEISLPSAIDGLCDGVTFDYYRFAAMAEQRIACEIVASRLGWDFDPFVRLLDARGNEVLRADDDPSAGADPRFVFQAPVDGQYVLELRDNRFKGGGRYRMRLGDFPIVSSTAPLAVQAGIPSNISFAGPLVERIAPLTVLPPGICSQRQLLSLSARAPSNQASGWATLVTTELQVISESASTDKREEATPVSLPAVVAGCLESPRDRDLFEFSAAKGISVTLRPITRSAGSPAILMLRLLDAKNIQVAESPITDSDESVWTVSIPSDGTYRLAVEDLAGRGGSDFTYAVEARIGPQFSLGLKVEKAPARTRISVPTGEAFHLDVVCARQAYEGPITLAIDSPRAGWQVFNNVIAPKANETRLIIVAPADLSPGELVPLRIVGRGDGSTGGQVAVLSTMTQLRAARPQTPYPPAWLDGQLFVSGMRDSPPFYTLRGDKTELNFPRLVGQTQFSLAFERIGDKFKDPITILPLGLPAGITAEIKRNGNGPKETYDILLKGAKDRAEEMFSFRYVAYGDLAGRGLAVQSGDIRVRVITPLAVTVAPAGPLVAGEKQKVKVTLVRQGDDQQPVDLTFKTLPPGVTAPEKTELAADQNEVEVELSAASDAPPVKFEQLMAVAMSKYAGKEISVESPAATLEVKAP